MRITAIEQIARHKVRVFLDGEPAFVLTDREADRWQLREDEEVQEERVDELRQYLAREAARTAMEMLMRRDYAEAELARRLREKGFGEQEALAGVAYVRGYHYLDDERYGRQLAAAKKGSISRRMMAYKMRQKGLDDDLIERILAESDWDDREGIRCEIRKKWHSSGELFEISEKDRQKFIQSLVRKGYLYSDIQWIWTHFGDENDDQPL